MRIILIFILSVSFRANEQVKNPFLSFEFDRVVMYDYEPYGEDHALVDSNGQLIKSVKIKKQVQLEDNTIKKLNLKLGDKKSYGGVMAMCFEPHLGIVYYLKGKIVRNVLICMECNRLDADIDIPAQHQNKQGSGKNIYYAGEGMSKDFRNYINNLLVKFKFSHQLGT